MDNMNWNYPTPIWFGLNRVNEIQTACENLNISKPLIVTDPGILKTNIISKVNNLKYKQFISPSISEKKKINGDMYIDPKKILSELKSE